MTFHNSIGAAGQMLLTFETRAFTQDGVVLEYFKKHSSKNFTPYEVWKDLSLLGYKYPITSVRRSINTLTKNMDLIKLNEQRPGEFDTPNNVWKLA